MQALTSTTSNINMEQISNETIKTIYQRRAVRKYKATLVEPSLIEQIIDAGRMAPSAINKQPWKFYVVSNKETISTFSKEIFRAAFIDTIKTGVAHVIKTAKDLMHFSNRSIHLHVDDVVFHGAPLVIFISSSKQNEWAELDVGMCAQNMMLAAKSMGIDSCPVGLAKFAAHAKSYSKLNVPATHRINLAVIFGYGNETPEIHERIKNNVVYID